jgi:uncharacterized delta-60 repeat protein
MFFNSLLNILPCRKLTVSSAYLTLLLLLFNLPAFAAAGDLDRSFGQDGVTASPGTSFFTARSVVLQPDGKIIAGGIYADFPTFPYSTSRYALVRYLPDGSIDTTFGTNGRVTTSFSQYTSTGAEFNDVAVLTDGKIVAVGQVRIPDSSGVTGRGSLLVVRYNADGSLDTTFNGNGIYIYSGGGSNVAAQKIAVLPDGKFLVAGYGGATQKGNPVPYKSFLFKFAGTGTDATFGSGGLVVTQASGHIQAYSIALQPDGKIVVGGKRSNNLALVFNLSVARYKPDGTLDESFGSGGMIYRTNENLSEAVEILIQPDGKIVAVSSVFADSNARDFAVLRLNPDGSPDAGFGTNGKVVTHVTDLSDVARAGALQPNGKIIVAGYSYNYAPGGVFPNPILLRYNPDGSLDRTFGIGGIVRTPSGASLTDTIIDEKGKILVTASLFYSDNVPPGFKVLRYLANGTREFDFDGDRKSDVSIFRPDAAAEWYWLNSSNDQSSGLQFGISSDKTVPADYDGDGKTDIAVFRDGDWYRLHSSDNQFVAAQFGQNADIPVPADFDGDSRADLAVYRAGSWYILNSADNSFRAEQFGISTDKPIIGDFDADGKADLAVYRDDTWYLLRSLEGFAAYQFGTSADKPVAGDYDGDGKTDLAVYRPADGTWYLLRSHAGFTAAQFGIATDKPVPADYDGDGKTDLAVYRDGDWYLLQSTAGFAAKQFGTANDRPIPNTFVP